jgi:hypothetical protein
LPPSIISSQKKYRNPSTENANPETEDLAVLETIEQEITRLPVRSALFKQRTGGLIVRWVTTSENALLNVFVFFLLVQMIVGVAFDATSFRCYAVTLGGCG